jgi:hypothetical protein
VIEQMKPGMTPEVRHGPHPLATRAPQAAKPVQQIDGLAS